MCWQALPAIVPCGDRKIGGLESFAWHLAQQLAKRDDSRVSLVVRSPGLRPPDQIQGVSLSVFRDPREYVRRRFSECIDLSNKRLKHFSADLLWQVPYLALTWPWRELDPPAMQPVPRLLNFDPDVWITLGVSRDSAGVVATGMQQRIPTVLLLQSNADLEPKFRTQPEYRNPYGELGEHCNFALQHADQIVCQTETQQELLYQRFDRNGVVLGNSIDIPPWQAASRESGNYVLWIGRYDRFHKRPLLAIETARLCPEIPFRMIINAGDEVIRQQVLNQKPDNVELIDFISKEEAPRTFGESRLFFSTGNAEFEGFPTVILEAIAAGKPIVSLEDFGNIIKQSEAGDVCGVDPARAATAVQSYWNNNTPYDQRKPLQFVNQRYSSSAIADHFMEILRDVTTSSTAD